MITRPHLDIDVVRNCTRRCAYCSHASPFVKPFEWSVDGIAKSLSILKPFLHVDHLMVLGGEPLLHSRIVDVLTVAKASGVANMVALTTNGHLLPRMPEEFWRELQRLQVSNYGSLPNETIAMCHLKRDKYGFLLDINKHEKFFSFNSNTDKSQYAECPWKNSCYTIHNGYFALCGQSSFYPERLGLDPNIDRLPLEGVTEEKLLQFMQRDLETCKYCHAYKEMVPWHECDTEEQWMKELNL